MSAFSNMKLRVKLILGFSIMLALTAVLGVVALAKLAAVRATTLDMADNWLPSVRTLADMRNDSANIRRAQYRLVIAKNDEGREEPRSAMKTGAEAFEKHRTEYVAMIASPEEKALYDKIAAGYEEYAKTEAEVDQLFKQGNAAGATEYVMTAQKASYDKLSAAIAEDIGLNNQGARSTRQRDPG